MPESIIDLADISSMGKISSSRPEKSSQSRDPKVKDQNRGFKTATDGRLIIDEMSGSDSDDDDDAGDDKMDDAAAGEDSDSNKRGVKDDSESEDEEEESAGPSRKRKAMDSRSMASSMRSAGGASSKYFAGGKGIHRPVAESVKSGASRATTAYGSEYKSKKASGDLKKKGQLDPYAYIPLSRSNLNKR